MKNASNKVGERVVVGREVASEGASVGRSLGRPKWVSSRIIPPRAGADWEGMYTVYGIRYMVYGVLCVGQ